MLNEAESLLLEAVQSAKEVLGRSHPSTLTYIEDFAKVLDKKL